MGENLELESVLSDLLWIDEPSQEQNSTSNTDVIAEKVETKQSESKNANILPENKKDEPQPVSHYSSISSVFLFAKQTNSGIIVSILDSLLHIEGSKDQNNLGHAKSSPNPSNQQIFEKASILVEAIKSQKSSPPMPGNR